MIRDWFFRNWMYAGLVAAIFLFAQVPLIAEGWSLPVALIFLQLPVYMVHQVEEHTGDRFRTFANTHLGNGHDVLPTTAVVFINILLVWVSNQTVIYLAVFVSLGLGLIAVYLSLVNAVTHIAAAFILRLYNPGLVTAIILFLPLGVWTIVEMTGQPGVGILDHVLGLAIALIVHAGIIGYVRHRRTAFGIK